jgi:K+-transporting ATPase ATPase C chain
MFIQHFRRAIVLTVILVILCLAYTGIETGIAQVFFRSQADGSMTKYGSSEIGQSWTGPKWFQGRDDSPNPAASGPTNYGPLSMQLYEQVKKQVALLETEGITPTNGLVTGSGSGLDPDIAPVDAYAQVNAVAKANDLPVAEVKQLVASHVAPVYLGVFGAPYVDVLDLNVALSQLVAAK